MLQAKAQIVDPVTRSRNVDRQILTLLEDRAVPSVIGKATSYMGLPFKPRCRAPWWNVTPEYVMLFPLPDRKIRIFRLKQSATS